MKTGRRKPKCLEKNLLQCHFDYHKSLEFNQDICSEKQGTNHLSYDRLLQYVKKL
jgi:hypothetical protein